MYLNYMKHVRYIIISVAQTGINIYIIVKTTNKMIQLVSLLGV